MNAPPLIPFSITSVTRGTQFPAPLNPYQASFFKLTQRSVFCVGQDAPVLQQKVGDDEGVSFPKPLDVPESASPTSKAFTPRRLARHSQETLRGPAINLS